MIGSRGDNPGPAPEQAVPATATDALAVSYDLPDGAAETVLVVRPFFQKGTALGLPEPEWFLCGTDAATGDPVVVPICLNPRFADGTK